MREKTDMSYELDRDEPDEFECERCWYLVNWREIREHDGLRMCADCRDELTDGEGE